MLRDIRLQAEQGGGPPDGGRIRRKGVGTDRKALRRQPFRRARVQRDATCAARLRKAHRAPQAALSPGPAAHLRLHRNKEEFKKLYGDEYVINCKDIMAKRMFYSHNETSATLGSQLLMSFAEENGYTILDSEEAIQYVKTGILSHSTSRVKKEPEGVEQKAVRVADKVAYIPQDLLDLLKQRVIDIDDLSSEEQGLLGLNEKQFTREEKICRIIPSIKI